MDEILQYLLSSIGKNGASDDAIQNFDLDVGIRRLLEESYRRHVFHHFCDKPKLLEVYLSRYDSFHPRIILACVEHGRELAQISGENRDKLGHLRFQPFAAAVCQTFVQGLPYVQATPEAMDSAETLIEQDTNPTSRISIQTDECLTKPSEGHSAELTLFQLAVAAWDPQSRNLIDISQLSLQELQVRFDSNYSAINESLLNLAHRWTRGSGLDVEDIVSQAFTNAMFSLNAEPIPNPVGLLWRIIYRRIADEFHKREQLPILPELTIEPIDRPHQDENDERRLRFHAFLARLSGPDLEIVIARAVDLFAGHGDYELVVQKVFHRTAFAMTPKTAIQRYSRALKQLEKVHGREKD